MVGLRWCGACDERVDALFVVWAGGEGDELVFGVVGDLEDDVLE
jgi:hypothetical protein